MLPVHAVHRQCAETVLSTVPEPERANSLWVPIVLGIVTIAIFIVIVILTATTGP